MKNICPLCNGLYEIKCQCQICNSSMKDMGAKVNFMDDYSPYLLDDISHLVDGAPRDQCVHFYHCPQCHENIQYSIERLEI